MNFMSFVKRPIAPLVLVLGLLVLQGGNARGQSLAPCSANGLVFAQCAAAWERVFISGQKAEDALTAWATASFQGFVDGVATATLDDEWCPNEAYSPEMLSALSAKFIREHPEKWSDPPVDLVLVPLAEAFPCGTNTERSDI